MAMYLLPRHCHDNGNEEWYTMNIQRYNHVDQNNSHDSDNNKLTSENGSDDNDGDTKE